MHMHTRLLTEEMGVSNRPELVDFQLLTKIFAGLSWGSLFLIF